ncbi:MAG: cell division protein FtsZ, partial [Bacteroidota bacterium]
KEEDKSQEEEMMRRRREMEQKRREKLRNSNVKLNNPKVVNELENEPAYLRRGVNLDEVPHADSQEYSVWTISDDDEPQIRANNSYLHDNVD